MKVPSVTEKELISFHDTHFPLAPLPSTFSPQVAQAEFADDGPFGLGYYHDGVPRSLTDEEISFLREREIQLLLKKRRLKRERKERKERKVTRKAALALEEEELFEEGELLELQTAQDASSAVFRESGEEPAAIKSLDRTVEAGQGDLLSVLNFDAIALSSSNHISATNRAKILKRKRERENQEPRRRSKLQNSSSSAEQFTHRRVARELDDAAEAPVELDY